MVTPMRPRKKMERRGCLSDVGDASAGFVTVFKGLEIGAFVMLALLVRRMCWIRIVSRFGVWL